MHHKVSVIMSVYNTPEKWLRQSIESVLNQTFKDFEFIIYEDCPTDNSEIIIDEYAKKDCRLRVVKNSVNKGLTRNLYEAVKISTGDYIARMDSDDICELDRLEKQVSYMDNNENVIVLGSYVNVFSESYNTIGMINLSDSIETNRIRMLFSNSGVAHSSAIIRRKFLIDKDINYRIEYAKSQDY